MRQLPEPAGQVLPPGGTGATPRLGVKIAVGAPITMGCLSIDGSRVQWEVGSDTRVGILQAMRRLDLALVGLPGARLPSGLQVPGRSDLGLAARGGPSYGSIAVVLGFQHPPSGG